MSLIKRSDWPSLVNGSWLSDFFDNDRLFDTEALRRQSMPSVNVKESEKDFEIEVAAPGLSKKDFTITVENGVITISSEQKAEKEEKEKDYTRREFSYSTFSRAFTLPENVNEDDVKAAYENGILKINISKKNITVSKAKKAIEVR